MKYIVVNDNTIRPLELLPTPSSECKRLSATTTCWLIEYLNASYAVRLELLKFKMDRSFFNWKYRRCLSAIFFYRAMLRRARLWDCMSSVRPSVCPSVTFKYRDHIGRNTSKIISRPNSLRSLLTISPTWAIWFNRNTPKIRVDRGGDRGVRQEHMKAVKSPKPVKDRTKIIITD